MDKLYSIEKNKINKRHLGKMLTSLVELDEVIISQLSREEAMTLFCNDLKSLLEIDDLRLLIKKLDQLDQSLLHYAEEGLNQELPQLGDFFKTLSPILLRSIGQTLDSFSEKRESHLKNDGETLLKGWLESIRISLEEEIHFRQ